MQVVSFYFEVWIILSFIHLSKKDKHQISAADKNNESFFFKVNSSNWNYRIQSGSSYEKSWAMIKIKKRLRLLCKSVIKVK